MRCSPTMGAKTLVSSPRVSVLKGSSYLRISVITTTGTDEAAEKALAATALPNM